MSLGLYFVTLTAFLASAHVGHKLDTGNPLNNAMRPGLARAASGLAAVAFVGLIVYGFVKFEWWAPLVGFVVAVIAGGAAAVPVLASRVAPGACIALALVGIVCAVAMLD